jgi:hypothetical protein
VTYRRHIIPASSGWQACHQLIFKSLTCHQDVINLSSSWEMCWHFVLFRRSTAFLLLFDFVCFQTLRNT